MALARIGLGANLGDAAATVRAAAVRLAELGRIGAVSSLYRSAPWGTADQPDFINAAVLLETTYEPRALLRALKRIEADFGRSPSYRWGPRHLDLDILTYDDLVIDEPDLTIPHKHLSERAFVLAPLAQIDSGFEPLLAALGSTERSRVRALSGIGAEAAESWSLMPDQISEANSSSGMTGRARRLAEAFAQTDLVRLKISGDAGSFEFRRAAGRPADAPDVEAPQSGLAIGEPARSFETISSDLVGIFHFSKPLPTEGESLEGDRELAFVEALGIRNPVRSVGKGRIAAILSRDGAAVEYGQPLFKIDRG